MTEPRLTVDTLTSDRLDELLNAEAAITRVRNLADRIQQGVPWSANADEIARRIHTATLVPRDPCPRCEDCPLIPRHQMAQHQRDHHPETVDAAPDRLAQSGVRTPGCTCGHDGMGVSWHGDDCPWRRGVLDGSAPEPGCSPGAAETEPNNHAPAERCCVCGGTPVTYHNYREQPFCWPCADCPCNQDVCVRTGINDPAVSESAARADRLASDLLDWRNLAAEHQQATIAAHERADRLAATLDEVLRHFVHRGHPGEPCLGAGWISVKTVDRWRAALNPAQEPDAAWTPPPPGSTAEQLPDHLLDLIRGGLPDYTSTACVTADALAVAVHWSHPRRAELGQWADRMHTRCRRNQKFTGQLCVCGCHQTEEQ